MKNFERICIEPDVRWVACTYNGKPRLGLDLGDDERNPDNLFLFTLDGYRSLAKCNMVNERDVTTIVCNPPAPVSTVTITSSFIGVQRA